MKTVKVLGILVFVFMLMFAVQAQADIVTYDLTVSNLSGVPGPYGTVSVNRTSGTTADVTFTRDDGFLFVDSNIGDLNVNGSYSASVSGLPNTPTIGSGQVDGFGFFNLTTDDPGVNNTDNITSFVISLTDTSGTWSSASDVLINNADGYLAAAHIWSPTANNPTGYAANGPSKVPEPAPVLLIGIGLAALALFGKSFSKKRKINLIVL